MTVENSAAQMSQLLLQMSDQVNNFNEKVLKVAVNQQVQASQDQVRAQATIDFLA